MPFKTVNIKWKLNILQNAIVIVIQISIMTIQLNKFLFDMKIESETNKMRQKRLDAMQFDHIHSFVLCIERKY